MAINGEDRRGPPRDGKVATATNDGGTPTAAALVVNLPPQGGYMTFENASGSLNTDIHIVFGSSASMGEPTTTTNAGLVKFGGKEDWYLGAGDRYFRIIASNIDGILRYWAS